MADQRRQPETHRLRLVAWRTDPVTSRPTRIALTVVLAAESAFRDLWYRLIRPILRWVFDRLGGAGARKAAANAARRRWLARRIAVTPMPNKLAASESSPAEPACRSQTRRRPLLDRSNRDDASLHAEDTKKADECRRTGAARKGLLADWVAVLFGMAAAILVAAAAVAAAMAAVVGIVAAATTMAAMAASSALIALAGMGTTADGTRGEPERKSSIQNGGGTLEGEEAKKELTKKKANKMTARLVGRERISRSKGNSIKRRGEVDTKQQKSGFETQSSRSSENVSRTVQRRVRLLSSRGWSLAVTALDQTALLGIRPPERQGLLHFIERVFANVGFHYDEEAGIVMVDTEKRLARAGRAGCAVECLEFGLRLCREEGRQPGDLCLVRISLVHTSVSTGAAGGLQSNAALPSAEAGPEAGSGGGGPVDYGHEIIAWVADGGPPVSELADVAERHGCLAHIFRDEREFNDDYRNDDYPFTSTGNGNGNGNATGSNGIGAVVRSPSPNISALPNAPGLVIGWRATERDHRPIHLGNTSNVRYPGDIGDGNNDGVGRGDDSVTSVRSSGEAMPRRAETTVQLWGHWECVHAMRVWLKSWAPSGKKVVVAPLAAAVVKQLGPGFLQELAPLTATLDLHTSALTVDCASPETDPVKAKDILVAKLTSLLGASFTVVPMPAPAMMRCLGTRDWLDAVVSDALPARDHVASKASVSVFSDWGAGRVMVSGVDDVVVTIVSLALQRAAKRWARLEVACFVDKAAILQGLSSRMTAEDVAKVTQDDRLRMEWSRTVGRLSRAVGVTLGSEGDRLRGRASTEEGAIVGRRILMDESKRLEASMRVANVPCPDHTRYRPTGEEKQNRFKNGFPQHPMGRLRQAPSLSLARTVPSLNDGSSEPRTAGVDRTESQGVALDARRDIHKATTSHVRSSATASASAVSHHPGTVATLPAKITDANALPILGGEQTLPPLSTSWRAQYQLRRHEALPSATPHYRIPAPSTTLPGPTQSSPSLPPSFKGKADHLSNDAPAHDRCVARPEITTVATAAMDKLARVPLGANCQSVSPRAILSSRALRTLVSPSEEPHQRREKRHDPDENKHVSQHTLAGQQEQQASKRYVNQRVPTAVLSPYKQLALDALGKADKAVEKRSLLTSHPPGTVSQLRSPPTSPQRPPAKRLQTYLDKVSNKDCGTYKSQAMAPKQHAHGQPSFRLPPQTPRRKLRRPPPGFRVLPPPGFSTCASGAGGTTMVGMTQGTGTEADAGGGAIFSPGYPNARHEKYAGKSRGNLPQAKTVAVIAAKGGNAKQEKLSSTSQTSREINVGGIACTRQSDAGLLGPREGLEEKTVDNGGFEGGVISSERSVPKHPPSDGSFGRDVLRAGETRTTLPSEGVHGRQPWAVDSRSPRVPSSSLAHVSYPAAQHEEDGGRTQYPEDETRCTDSSARAMNVREGTATETATAREPQQHQQQAQHEARPSTAARPMPASDSPGESTFPPFQWGMSGGLDRWEW